jgi:exodeoxyribonuclease VII small subunit
MTAPTEPGTPLEGLTFDAALVALEETVAALEAGGQQLEDTIALYERAVALERHCSKLLADARLRMEQLVERAGGGLDVVALKDEPEAQA